MERLKPEVLTSQPKKQTNNGELIFGKWAFFGMLPRISTR